MTLVRHFRKSPPAKVWSWPAVVLLFAAGIPVICGAGPTLAGITTSERTVIDWRTGLAISGYDPVAYFVDHAPMPGQPAFEYVHAEATWQFRNLGNRAAFAAHPDVYMPQFGGYDPVQAAQGLAVAGNPMLWLIVGNRLFLFYDAANRARFAADPQRYVEAAHRKWPTVIRALVP